MEFVLWISLFCLGVAVGGLAATVGGAMLIVKAASQLPRLDAPPSGETHAGSEAGPQGATGSIAPDVQPGGEQGYGGQNPPSGVTAVKRAPKTRCAFCEAARAALGISARALAGKK